MDKAPYEFDAIFWIDYQILYVLVTAVTDIKFY